MALSRYGYGDTNQYSYRHELTSRTNVVVMRPPSQALEKLGRD